MEQPLITAVTHSTKESRMTLNGIPDEPGAAARIFDALARANVNVDMIVQNVPIAAGGLAEISFTIPKDDLRAARAALEPLEGDAFAHMSPHEEMGKVSIVGAGMRSHPGVAAKVFGVLAGEGVNIDMISTSPIKISCVIDRERVDDAVQALHSAFELAGDGTIAEEQPFKMR
jgi:aspartate kinase